MSQNTFGFNSNDFDFANGSLLEDRALLGGLDVTINDPTLKPTVQSGGAINGAAFTVLASAIDEVKSTLSELGDREDIDEILGVSFGVSSDDPEVADLLTDFGAADFSDLPQIDVLTEGELGSALGAYAAETDTVYLPDELLRSGDVNRVADVLLEEFGHGLDARWNVVDSPGDEGKIFTLSLKELFVPEDILQESDWSILQDSSNSLDVELSIPPESLDFFVSKVEWPENLGEVRYDFPGTPLNFDPLKDSKTDGILQYDFTYGGGTFEFAAFANDILLGEADFSYPLQLDLGFPSSLEGETFIAPSVISSGSGTFNEVGTKPFKLPNAGVKIASDLKPSSFSRLAVNGAPNVVNEALSKLKVDVGGVKSEVVLDANSLAGIINQGIGSVLGSSPVSGSINLVPSFSSLINQKGITASSNLTSIEGSWKSNNVIDIALDVDGLILSLNPAYSAISQGVGAAGRLGDIELSGLGFKVAFPSSVQQKRELSDAQKRLESDDKIFRDTQQRLQNTQDELENLPDTESGQVAKELFQPVLQEDEQNFDRALAQRQRTSEEVSAAQSSVNSALEIEQNERFKVELAGELLDIKANIGAAFQQDFSFSPSDVQITLSTESDGLINGTSEFTRSLGEEFTITPPEGSGVMEINTKYELKGSVDNNIGLILQGGINTKVLEAQGKVSLPLGISASTKFGPLFSPQVSISSSDFGADPFPFIDSQPILVEALPGEELADDSSNSAQATKNLVIERTYQIPYGIPLSVSNASAEEGKNIEFTISLQEPRDTPYTVNYSTQLLGSGEGFAGAGDFSAIEGTSLTFAVGETEKTVEIPTIDDEIRESSEIFEISVTPASGDPVFQQGDVTVDSVTGTGTILDDEDPKPEPPRDGIGNTHNDPRLGTFDGVGYSFQAVGEFTLVESKTDDFLIQTRQSPASPGSRSVSSNSAVATRLDGKRVGIYAGTDNPLLIDGQPTTIPNNGSIAVGDGRIYLDDNIYTIVYGTGEQLEAKISGNRRIDVKTYLDEDRAGDVQGLLGNSNDDRNDDFALRDGTILQSPIPEGQIYTTFANNWRITQEESLFDYAEGTDTNSFTDLTFPEGIVGVDDLDPEARALAEALVDEAGLTDPILRDNTIVDLVLTRAEDGSFDLSLIETALTIEPPAEALIVGVPPEANNDFTTTNINLETPVNVLANDTGTLTVPLSIAQFDFTTAQGGNVRFNDAGTPDDTNDDFLIYTPPTDFTGQDSFNYVLSDGTQTAGATATIQIDRLSLAQLDGQNGFKLNGADAGDLTGLSVSDVGDINNDGFDDLAVGALTADPEDRAAAGKTYIVYGHNNGFSAELDLSTLDGSNGFVLNGVTAEDLAGGAISAVGDLNGDGIDDMAIGASGAAPDGLNDAGLVHVVYGGGDFGASFDLANLNGQNGFTVSGSNEFDYVGLALSGGGDVNDDGVDDLIVSAPGGFGEAQNKTYVIYGQQGGIGATLDVSSIDGSNGFVIVDNNGNSGLSVSNAGDFNGDGMTDIAIGSDATNPDNTAPDETYIVFGSKDMGGTFDLAQLDGTNGVTLSGFDVPNFLGTTVSDAGDVNGDGFNDLIVGAFGADDDGNSAAGKTYVLFGTDLKLPDRIDVSNLGGSGGFIIEGANDGDFSGVSVSSAGDINGDGMSDLLVGASEVDASGQANSGQVSVLFGRSRRSSRNLKTNEIDGNNGFTIDGVEIDALTGTAVSSAGDLNGDSFDDILIGAPGNFFNDAPGQSYVVLGRSAFGATAANEDDNQEIDDRAEFVELYGLSPFFITTT